MSSRFVKSAAFARPLFCLFCSAETPGRRLCKTLRKTLRKALWETRRKTFRKILWKMCRESRICAGGILQVCQSVGLMRIMPFAKIAPHLRRNKTAGLKSVWDWLELGEGRNLRRRACNSKNRAHTPALAIFFARTFACPFEEWKSAVGVSELKCAHSMANGNARNFLIFLKGFNFQV